MQFNYTQDALYHPEKIPAFVGHTPELVFDPQDPGFSLTKAWWLSNSSHLAYLDEPALKPALADVGLELVRFFDHNATQAYVAKGDGFGILAFRGTEVDEFRDILTDIKIPLVEFSDGAKVHEGFLEALDQVWGEAGQCLNELENDGIPVWYTGHSLGAALATLAAARKKPAALYTFASPRVGNEAFCGLIDLMQPQRFVNCADIVTTLPPTVFGYRHVGDKHFITAKGVILTNPSPSRVRWLKLKGLLSYAAKLPWLRGDMVNLRMLVDHAVVNYSAGIWAQMIRDERPYT